MIRDAWLKFLEKAYISAFNTWHVICDKLHEMSIGERDVGESLFIGVAVVTISVGTIWLDCIDSIVNSTVTV